MFGSSGAKAAALRSSRSASPVRPKLQREVIYGGIEACECLRTRSRINGGPPLHLHILSQSGSPYPRNAILSYMRTRLL